MDKGGSAEIRPCNGQSAKARHAFFNVNLGLAETKPSSGGDGNANRGGTLLVMPQADMTASSLVTARLIATARHRYLAPVTTSQWPRCVIAGLSPTSKRDRPAESSMANARDLQRAARPSSKRRCWGCPGARAGVVRLLRLHWALLPSSHQLPVQSRHPAPSVRVSPAPPGRCNPGGGEREGNGRGYLCCSACRGIGRRWVSQICQTRIVPGRTPLAKTKTIRSVFDQGHRPASHHVAQFCAGPTQPGKVMCRGRPGLHTLTREFCFSSSPVLFPGIHVNVHERCHNPHTAWGSGRNAKRSTYRLPVAESAELWRSMAGCFWASVEQDKTSELDGLHRTVHGVCWSRLLGRRSW